MRWWVKGLLLNLGWVVLLAAGVGVIGLIADSYLTPEASDRLGFAVGVLSFFALFGGSALIWCLCVLFRGDRP